MHKLLTLRERALQNGQRFAVAEYEALLDAAYPGWKHFDNGEDVLSQDAIDSTFNPSI